MPSLAEQAQDIAARYQPPITGRPSLLGDPETLAEFIRAIEDGNYIETAAHLAGICTETLRQWHLRAERDEEPHKAFIALVKKAERRAEALAVAKVRKAGEDPRFWAAEMTFLERRHPERWGRRSEGNDGAKVQVFIGIKDSEVQVQIASGYTSQPSALPDSVSISQSDPIQTSALTDSND